MDYGVRCGTCLELNDDVKKYYMYAARVEILKEEAEKKSEELAVLALVGTVWRG